MTCKKADNVKIINLRYEVACGMLIVGHYNMNITVPIECLIRRFSICVH